MASAEFVFLNTEHPLDVAKEDLTDDLYSVALPVLEQGRVTIDMRHAGPCVLQATVTGDDNIIARVKDMRSAALVH